MVTFCVGSIVLIGGVVAAAGSTLELFSFH